MATTDLLRDSDTFSPPLERAQLSAVTRGALLTLLLPLASLRLTVVLFAASIFLVLAGTLAQIDYDVWYVVNNYFRCPLAWIELKIFFPRAWEVPGAFPFPGGWLIGAALGVNLLVAHGLRFKVTGSGRTLRLGIALIVCGAALTYAVIQSGLDDTVESELSPAFCNGLWHALRAALGGGTLLLGYVLALNYRTQRLASSFWLWCLAAAACVVFALLGVWLFLHPEAQLDPSGLRILWQLIKGGSAGLVLLAGCHYVFGRRAGIVLLHSGIALLMFSELFTGLKAEEAQMRIVEGQTLTFAEDIRSAELAIVDKTDPHEDVVMVVPDALLKRAFKSQEPIDAPTLPFVIRVTEYLPNATTRLVQPGEVARATRGEGQLRIAEVRPTATGVAKEQTVDLPAAYVELVDRATHQSLGTVLLWALPSPSYLVEPVQVGEKSFEVGMRLKQLPKPYSVELIDFRHDRYVGTDTPKNYSSEVRLRDPAQHVDRTVKIWMNNPLRYGGDTLYQASFDKDNPRLTVLQVVTNSGWMIPYVACMLIGTGMLAHFGTMLFRFSQRKAAPNLDSQRLTWAELASDWRCPTVWAPAAIVLVFAGWVLGKTHTAAIPPTQMQIDRFSQLPVAFQGRVQPFDTLARNALTILSHREELIVPTEKSGFAELFGIEKKAPAIRWLLDWVANSPAARDHRCLRIDNLEVLQALGLERRDGFRYSLAELFEHHKTYMQQKELAREVEPDARTLTQAKFIELGEKVSLLSILRASFASPAREIRMDSHENARQDVLGLAQEVQSLSFSAPRPVPPVVADGVWRMLVEAELEPLLDIVQGRPPGKLDPATEELRSILDAYADDDAQAFNQRLADYQPILNERAAAEVKFDQELAARGEAGPRKTAEKLDVARLRFEVFFNGFRPFVLAMALYIVAFVLAACSWMGATRVLNRSANWLLWFTFLLHTAALVARIYISGRPPVTNLYSSAVFIGWAAVLFALVFEWIYRFGIGNLLAAVIGFPTLFVAHNLAGDGDTFQVLQAVLDTQFWLATHVVCITLGYATTILAGMLGVTYVLLGQAAGRLEDAKRQQLVRMIYGTLCFATFFSFVGTILGGLWADDSWGRFWGWDPKENGALIIVLWNALVLHARWGGMIGRRGLAVLAIFGNVVTAWSWFGVNTMDVGLHSYGRRPGMVFWLMMFVLSQLAIILLGSLLPESRRAAQDH